MHDISGTQFQGFGEMESEAFEFEEGETFGEGPFSAEEEMELAGELLGVSNEAELDQFLGSLIKKAGSAVGKFVKSPIGKSLGGILKSAAKTALPMVGGALGNLVLPGVGGAVGSKLASSAGKMFGLELEGLSMEDQEFEVARKFVRFAGDAAQKAASAPPTANPQAAANTAAVSSAQRHAPGLLQNKVRSNGTQQGRWVRRGQRIVLLGV